MLRLALISVILTALFTVLLGGVYPLLVTAGAQLVFPFAASGSLIERDGQTVGSELVGQPFTQAKYFWPRPSAAAYNAAASSGSNLGPSNPALREAVAARKAALEKTTLRPSTPVPPEMLTTSASGLDPHIGLDAALWQAPRVAQARGMKLPEVEALVRDQLEDSQLGVLGQPRVNVLRLNLTLDQINGR